MSSGIINSPESNSGIVGNRLNRNTRENVYRDAYQILQGHSRTANSEYASTATTLPTLNGLYWIDPGVTGSRPVRAYCDFTSVTGTGADHCGGFILVGKFTDGTASRWDWEDPEFVREYTDDPTGVNAGGMVMSALREFMPFRYLRIAWSQGAGAAAPIYDFGEQNGGLVNIGSTSKSRVGSAPGNSGILTTSSFGALGSYSATTLYHKKTGAGYRGHWYTNYDDNSDNTDGFFGLPGDVGAASYAGSTLNSGNSTVGGAIAWAEFWIGTGKDYTEW